MASETPTDLRITEPYAKALVSQVHRLRGGQGAPTKTATQMLIERGTQILEPGRPLTTATGNQPIGERDARNGNDAA